MDKNEIIKQIRKQVLRNIKPKSYNNIECSDSTLFKVNGMLISEMDCITLTDTHIRFKFKNVNRVSIKFDKINSFEIHNPDYMGINCVCTRGGRNVFTSSRLTSDLVEYDQESVDRAVKLFRDYGFMLFIRDDYDKFYLESLKRYDSCLMELNSVIGSLLKVLCVLSEV